MHGLVCGFGKGFGCGTIAVMDQVGGHHPDQTGRIRKQRWTRLIQQHHSVMALTANQRPSRSLTHHHHLLFMCDASEKLPGCEATFLDKSDAPRPPPAPIPGRWRLNPFRASNHSNTELIPSGRGMKRNGVLQPLRVSHSSCSEQEVLHPGCQ